MDAAEAGHVDDPKESQSPARVLVPPLLERVEGAQEFSERARMVEVQLRPIFLVPPERRLEIIRLADDLWARGHRPGTETAACREGSWTIRNTPEGRVLDVHVRARSRGPWWAGLESTPMAQDGSAGRRVAYSDLALAAYRMMRVGLPELAVSLGLCHLYDRHRNDRIKLARYTASVDLDQLPAKVARLGRKLKYYDFDPHPHQRAAFALGALSNLSLGIADSMGLGKSVEALSFLALSRRRTFPALIVAPASVLRKWPQEIKAAFPWMAPTVLSSERGWKRSRAKFPVYVTTWDLLRTRARQIKSLGVQSMIVDEAHNGKNLDAKRTRAWLWLARDVPYRIPLTGTAILSKPEEAWTILHFIDPKAHPSPTAFEDAHSKGLIVVRKGPRQFDRFAAPEGYPAREVTEAYLRGYLIRRLKSDVLDLPPKSREQLWIELDEGSQAAYDRAKEEQDRWLAKAIHRIRLKQGARMYFLGRRGGMSHAEAMEGALAGATGDLPASQTSILGLHAYNELRRLVGRLKAAAAIEWIVSALKVEQTPIVVFAEHHKVVRALRAGLRAQGIRSTEVTGKVRGSERQRRIRHFQSGGMPVLIGTKAIREGVNLTSSRRVLFVERWFVTALEEQGEDRCHRIGQTEPVEVTYLMAKGTVDEDVAALLDTKRELVDAVLGGETVKDSEEETEMQLGKVSKALAGRIIQTAQRRLERSDQWDKVGKKDLIRYIRGAKRSRQ